jgi:hypothetical protein
MSTIKDDKKKSKGPLVITKQSPKKQNLDRRTSNSQQSITHIIFGECCPDVLDTEKYKMQLNKKEDEHDPLKNGRCGVMITLPLGFFSNLPPDF